MRFWDTSALVPLVVQQSVSMEAEAWLEEDEGVVVWTLTAVEIVSALRRMVREGALEEPSSSVAESVANDIFTRVHVVTDVERVKRSASRLLRVHSLRAADACQLAAAQLWADGDPDGLVLHTFDRRLGSAAMREGFAVVPEPTSS